MKLVATFFLLAVVRLSLGQLEDDFWDFNTDGAVSGEDVVLNCNFTYQDEEGELIPENATYRAIEWMLPNLTRIDSTSSYPDYDVSADGYYLTVISVDRYLTGTYHCILEVTLEEGNQQLALIRKGLHLKGPYFISSKDLWQESYRTPFIIAISSSLGFVAACALMYMVYMCRWVAPEGWYDDQPDTAGNQAGLNNHELQQQSYGYDNTGFAGFNKEEMEHISKVAPGFVQSPDVPRYRLSSSDSRQSDIISTTL